VKDREAGGGIAAGGDITKSVAITGDNNTVKVLVIADPDKLWQILSKRSPSQDLLEATQGYLTFLVGRYRCLDFKGMGVSDRVPLKLPLVDLYVPLKARAELPEAGETLSRDARLAGRNPSAEEVESMGHRLSEPRELLGLLRERDGLIILGDPGAGKTTFLKYVALRLASGEGGGLGLGVKLPILLPLSAYANALEEGDVPLDRFIADYYRGRGIPFPIEDMLGAALCQGGALLLLDGLDEVKDLGRRRVVVDRVSDFFALHRGKGNKFLLTSRIVGYRDVRPAVEGLAECTLMDFDEEDVERFTEKWTKAIEKAARGDTKDASEEAAREKKELLAAIRGNPGVRTLASNPLLLTILALMKRQGVTLPERRVELYQKYLETLIKHWNLARGLGRPTSRDLDPVETLKVLAPLALWMHETSPGVGLVKREDLRRKLEEIYRSGKDSDPEKAARQFLADVHDQACLLLERGAGEYGFIHLTFQEYLAAVAVAQQGQEEIDPVVEVFEAHLGDPSWREVLLLAVGYLGIIQQRDRAAGAVLESLILRFRKGALRSFLAKCSSLLTGRIPPPRSEPGQAAVLCGEAVADASPGGVTPACRSSVVKAVMETMRGHGRAKPAIRVAAGNALARLGDPRFRQDAWCLPDEPLLGFVEVPGGKFRMGEGKEAHEVDLPAFYMASYPVTVAQFRAFVEASGHTPGNPISNRPVVRVNWNEAVAYCRWLTERLREWEGTPEPLATLLRKEGWLITLPSEAEWEKAARGTDGRRFPWGDEPDPDRANYSDTRIGATSAVGCFPKGASPYGIEDMSGNVWEWTRSVHGEYPYDPRDGRENLDAHGDRALRGGAFYRSHVIIRCASRGRRGPGDRGVGLGFRVVASPFSSGL
jgi:formylglycine-generating enzyme required for sulfatase activity